jgi:hypothetical protein
MMGSGMAREPLEEVLKDRQWQRSTKQVPYPSEQEFNRPKNGFAVSHKYMLLFPPKAIVRSTRSRHGVQNHYHTKNTISYRITEWRVLV